MQLKNYDDYAIQLLNRQLKITFLQRIILEILRLLVYALILHNILNVNMMIFLFPFVGESG